MPTEDDGILENPPINLDGENQMAVENPVAEASNLQVALTGMANEAAASSGMRISRFSQLGADAAAMWSVAMTTPTMYAAEAIGVVNRTRNNPTPTIQS